MTYRFLLLICLLTAGGVSVCSADPDFSVGLEVLAAEHPDLVAGKSIALLVSSNAFDRSLRHSIDRLGKAARIAVIFTGEGYFRPTVPGERGRKMDAAVGAPVVEILDALEKPVPADLRGAEILVIDIQDIGIRYFNYITLLAQFLDLARTAGLPVLLLDRPNPINGRTISGPVLDVGFRSRFGVYPIPLVYGMTIGELGLFFNKEFGLGAKLTVIGMEGYQRGMTFRDTGLPWFPASDHLPEPESVAYYAISGFLGEMGIFSTGVGTTRPFHYILAPWMDGQRLAEKLERMSLPGVRFLPAQVKAYYGLFQQKKVPGLELIISDQRLYDPFLAGLAILRTLWDLYPDKIPLGNPALAGGLDTLLGGSSIRTGIIQGLPVLQIHAGFQRALAEFLRKRASYLMYPES